MWTSQLEGTQRYVRQMATQQMMGVSSGLLCRTNRILQSNISSLQFQAEHTSQQPPVTSGYHPDKVKLMSV
jgi:hypothetical protein